MIYFKIEDTESVAWARYQVYQDRQQKVIDQIKQLMKTTGIESEQFYFARNGRVDGFKHTIGAPIPEGMRVVGGMLKPHRRNKVGKHISAAMRALKYPTGDELMAAMVGAIGELAAHHDYKSGMGLYGTEHVVLLYCHWQVWEDAQAKLEFTYPEGLVEITAGEYHQLKEAEEKAGQEVDVGTN